MYERPVTTTDVVSEYDGFKKPSVVPATRHPILYEYSFALAVGPDHVRETELGETLAKVGGKVRAAG